jgi:hypothetical protein
VRECRKEGYQGTKKGRQMKEGNGRRKITEGRKEGKKEGRRKGEGEQKWEEREEGRKEEQCE